ncbi:MAG: pseudouridine synthase, partial [Nitrospinota bacterium]
MYLPEKRFCKNRDRNFGGDGNKYFDSCAGFKCGDQGGQVFVGKISRAYQVAISQEHVLLSGVRVKPGYRLRGGEEVTIHIPEPEVSVLKPEKMDLNIVYEDESVLVVDKPAAMVVHPGAGNRAGTLVNALLNHCRDLKGVGGVERPGIVHRLDKDTSGLRVVAKDDL